jgi:hypothetical protein
MFSLRISLFCIIKHMQRKICKVMDMAVKMGANDWFE